MKQLLDDVWDKKGPTFFLYTSGKKHSGEILVTNLPLENDRATLYNFMALTFPEAAFSVSPDSLIIRLGPTLTWNL